MTAPWEFVLRDAEGGIVDLTGATVSLKMRELASATNKINGSSVTVTSATNGVCEYDVQAADVNAAGSYEIELTVTDSNSNVLKNFEGIPVEIKESF